MKNSPFKITVTIIICLCLSSCFGKQAPAPYHHYGATSGAGSTGIHSVILGDNLWGISQRYKVDMKDIIIKNKLQSPYRLRIGQRLVMPTSKIYKVRSGDSLYAISRSFDISITRLAKRNNITSPYTIYEGQILYLSSNATKYSKSNAREIKTASVVPRSAIRKSKIVDLPPKASGRFMLPVSGRIISSFGPKKGGMHNDGINILAKRGAKVSAAENGVVAYVGSELQGFGNLILVRHENRYMTAYAHLDKILVKKGQIISKGFKIGNVGSTGGVDKPQLHFELRRGTKAINPAKYF